MSVDPFPVVTVPTPNPDALMFRVEESLVPRGTFEFHLGEPTERSPLAARLLAIDGVELVLIAPRFVTVGKANGAEWPGIVPFAKEAIRATLLDGEMAVYDETAPAAPTADSEVERRLIAFLDEEIRPAVAGDGGDIIYGGFVDGIVRLQLIGACGSCPSSTTTLRMGIERMLMEEFPEVSGVEQI